MVVMLVFGDSLRFTEYEDDFFLERGVVVSVA